MNKFNNLTTKDLYFCYSMKLFHFLKSNGFYYKFKDVNPSSGLYYWAFERTDELHDALKQYSKKYK